MTVQFVLLPLFVHVALTFVWLFWTGPLVPSYSARAPAAREPYLVELAVLFYTAVILIWVTRQADLLLVVLAWVFVIVQFGHLFLGVAGRRTTIRPAWVFTAEVAVLAIIWLVFALKLLLRI
jgi:hypothetical protein